MGVSKFLVSSSLSVEVFTVGFGGVGESIIVLIKMDGNVVKSILVDYYLRIRTPDVIKDILDKNNVKWIDYICWTHPHRDHTIGLADAINLFSNENTVFMYPAYLVGLDWTKRDIDSKNIINLIKQTQNKSGANSNYIGKLKPVMGSMELYRCTFDYNSKSNFLSIHVLSPDSTSIEQKMLRKDENKINDFSISLKISLGSANIILSGDIQNNSISKVDEHLRPDDIEYLKVPHHGSIGSIDILDWIPIDKSIGTSVVTGYSPSKLPEKQVLNLYSKKSRKMFSINKQKTNSIKYGYVQTIFDMISETCDHVLEGNAIEIL